MCILGSQLLCQGRTQATSFQDNFISFNSVTLRKFLMIKYSEVWSKHLNSVRTISEGRHHPDRWQAKIHLEAISGSRDWYHRGSKWSLGTDLGRKEPTSDFSIPCSDCEIQCILQCYAQQRNNSDSRGILLTSKRPLSYASKDFKYHILSFLSQT